MPHRVSSSRTTAGAARAGGAGAAAASGARPLHQAPMPGHAEVDGPWQASQALAALSKLLPVFVHVEQTWQSSEAHLSPAVWQLLQMAITGSGRELVVRAVVQGSAQPCACELFGAQVPPCPPRLDKGTGLAARPAPLACASQVGKQPTLRGVQENVAQLLRLTDNAAPSPPAPRAAVRRGSATTRRGRASFSDNDAVGAPGTAIMFPQFTTSSDSLGPDATPRMGDAGKDVQVLVARTQRLCVLMLHDACVLFRRAGVPSWAVTEYQRWVLGMPGSARARSCSAPPRARGGASSMANAAQRVRRACVAAVAAVARRGADTGGADSTSSTGTPAALSASVSSPDAAGRSGDQAGVNTAALRAWASRYMRWVVRHLAGQASIASALDVTDSAAEAAGPELPASVPKPVLGVGTQGSPQHVLSMAQPQVARASPLAMASSNAHARRPSIESRIVAEDKWSQDPPTVSAAALEAAAAAAHVPSEDAAAPLHTYLMQRTVAQTGQPAGPGAEPAAGLQYRPDVRLVPEEVWSAVSRYGKRGRPSQARLHARDGTQSTHTSPAPAHSDSGSACHSPPGSLSGRSGRASPCSISHPAPRGCHTSQQTHSPVSSAVLTPSRLRVGSMDSTQSDGMLILGSRSSLLRSTRRRSPKHRLQVTEALATSPPHANLATAAAVKARASRGSAGQSPLRVQSGSVSGHSSVGLGGRGSLGLADTWQPQTPEGLSDSIDAPMLQPPKVHGYVDLSDISQSSPPMSSTAAPANALAAALLGSSRPTTPSSLQHKSGAGSSLVWGAAPRFSDSLGGGVRSLRISPPKVATQSHSHSSTLHLGAPAFITGLGLDTTGGTLTPAAQALLRIQQADHDDVADITSSAPGMPGETPAPANIPESQAVLVLSAFARDFGVSPGLCSPAEWASNVQDALRAQDLGPRPSPRFAMSYSTRELSIGEVTNALRQALLVSLARESFRAGDMTDDTAAVLAWRHGTAETALSALLQDESHQRAAAQRVGT